MSKPQLPKALTPVERYWRSYRYWEMGERYLHVARIIALQVASHKNQFVAVSDKPLDAEQLSRLVYKKTKWGDSNVVEPLLFDLFHGLELMLKGFSLLHLDQPEQLDNRVSVSYDDFVRHYPEETKVISILRQYVEKDGMRDLLRDFFRANGTTVDQYYEVLRYPCSKKSEQMFNHIMLKFQGEDGIPFYRQMARDIRALVKEMATVGRKECPNA